MRPTWTTCARYRRTLGPGFCTTRTWAVTRRILSSSDDNYRTPGPEVTDCAWPMQAVADGSHYHRCNEVPGFLNVNFLLRRLLRRSQELIDRREAVATATDGLWSAGRLCRAGAMLRRRLAVGTLAHGRILGEGRRSLCLVNGHEYFASSHPLSQCMEKEWLLRLSRSLDDNKLTDVEDAGKSFSRPRSRSGACTCRQPTSGPSRRYALYNALLYSLLFGRG